MLTVPDLDSKHLNDELVWLPVKEIKRDVFINTRPVDQKWVAQKVAVFNPNAIGVLYVALMHENADYIVIDGQNRRELVRQARGDDYEVPCRVYFDLTREQAAELFIAFARARKLLPLHTFAARLTAREPLAIAIQAIVEKHGWRIEGNNTARSIRAVTHLDRIFMRLPEARKDQSAGEAALDLTLGTLTKAWGYQPGAVHGDLLLGVTAVFLRYGEAIDPVNLAERLARFQGGPTGFLGKARGVNEARSGGYLWQSVAEVTVNLYNQRRRYGLPDWQRQSTIRKTGGH